jgi:CubicO group peptidase (beta-lactamase class C family)
MALLMVAALQAQPIDEIVGKVVAPNGPGAGVMVIRDGTVAFQKGYGLANVEHRAPITPRSVFELASVSKQFTAYAIMILSDRGALAFDDDARKVLPELPEYDPKRPIRVADLLYHTSGIIDYIGLLDQAGRDKYTMRNEDVLKLLVGRKLEFPTGTKWRYSNSNYCLLALIVERLTKKSFGAFMREEIFEPLGMKDSLIFEDAHRVIPNRAYGYARTKRAVTFAHHYLVMTGDGGVMTTLEDFAKWDAELRSPTRVKPETLRRAFVPGALDDGKTHGYGFGWSIGAHLKRPLVSHAGGWAGASTWVGRYPDDALTVVIFSNDERLGAEALGRKIARACLGGK